MVIGQKTYLYQQIANASIKEFLRHSSFELVKTPPNGSSGSEVYIFRDQKTLSMHAVKCAKNPRVTFREEKERKEKLEQYLGHYLPGHVEVSYVNDTDVLISSARGVYTLQQIIETKPTLNSFAIWESVLGQVYATWKHSAYSGFDVERNPRHHQKRCMRVLNGLGELKISNISFADYMNKPMLVNGVRHQSLFNIMRKIAAVHSPEFSVACHGDPQPSNIVVGHNSWYFVDWEWSGKQHDWRIMYSHLYGWWQSRFNKNLMRPEIKIEKGLISLQYKTEIPQSIRKYQQATKALFYKMTNVRRVQDDFDDLNRFLALLYLGEARWRTRDAVIPLLGAAIELVSQLPQDEAI